MSVTLRPIQDEDLEVIMNWRTDPDITRYMNTNPKLTLEGQREWLASLEKNDKVMYWVVEQNQNPIGIINLADIDWTKKTSSWGYYIGEKKARSLQLAISLEMSLYDYVFDVLDFEELHNEVFSLNEGVIKLHLACGSHIDKEVRGEIEKEGIAYDITHISIKKSEWNRIKLNKKYEKINFDLYLAPHHVGYAVADIDKALSQYKLMSYYQASPIYDDIDRNVRIVFVESKQGNMRIELISPMNDKSPITKTLSNMKNMSSPYHICYEVKSLDAAIATFKKRGFILTQNPAKAIAFNNARVVFMINREAGMIELVESINTQ